MYIELFRKNDDGRSLLNLDGCKDISCWDSKDGENSFYNITFVFDAPYNEYEVTVIERNPETNERMVKKETKHQLEYTQTFETKEQRDKCYEEICKNLVVVRANKPTVSQPQILNE